MTPTPLGLAGSKTLPSSQAGPSTVLGVVRQPRAEGRVPSVPTRLVLLEVVHPRLHGVSQPRKRFGRRFHPRAFCTTLWPRRMEVGSRRTRVLHSWPSSRRLPVTTRQPRLCTRRTPRNLRPSRGDHPNGQKHIQPRKRSGLPSHGRVLTASGWPTCSDAVSKRINLRRTRRC